MAVYNVDENLTPILLSAMHTCFISHLLVLALALVLLQLHGLDYNTGHWSLCYAERRRTPTVPHLV